MGQIAITNPVRFWFGEECLTQLGDEAAAHGRRVLLVTEGSYSESGLAVRVQDIIERRGLNCLVFDEIVRTDPVVSLDEALKVSRGSRATSLVGLGGVHTLMIARAAAALAECRLNGADLFENEKLDQAEGIPYYEVPASGRNPFMFRSESCLWDPYNNGAPGFITLPNHLMGGVFMDASLTASRPEKYSLFIFLEELLGAVEGFLSPRGNFLTRQLLGAALERTSPLLQLNYHHVSQLDWRTPRMEAAAYSAMGQSVLSPGKLIVFAYAAADQWRVPRSAVAALLLPAFLESPFAAQSSLRQELEGLLVPRLGDDPLVGLAETLRTWISEAQLPLRLRDLQLKMDQLSTTIERVKEHPLFTGASNDLSPADLFQLIKNSY